jgi:hypothetical protein
MLFGGGGMNESLAMGMMGSMGNAFTSSSMSIGMGMSNIFGANSGNSGARFAFGGETGGGIGFGGNVNILPFEDMAIDQMQGYNAGINWNDPTSFQDLGLPSMAFPYLPPSNPLAPVANLAQTGQHQVASTNNQPEQRFMVLDQPNPPTKENSDPADTTLMAPRQRRPAASRDMPVPLVAQKTPLALDWMQKVENHLRSGLVPKDWEECLSLWRRFEEETGALDTTSVSVSYLCTDTNSHFNRVVFQLSVIGHKSFPNG